MANGIVIFQTLMWVFSGITTLWMVICWFRGFVNDVVEVEYFLYSLLVALSVFGMASFAFKL